MEHPWRRRKRKLLMQRLLLLVLVAQEGVGTTLSGEGECGSDGEFKDTLFRTSRLGVPAPELNFNGSSSSSSSSTSFVPFVKTAQATCEVQSSGWNRLDSSCCSNPETTICSAVYGSFVGLYCQDCMLYGSTGQCFCGCPEGEYFPGDTGHGCCEYHGYACSNTEKCVISGLTLRCEQVRAGFIMVTTMARKEEKSADFIAVALLGLAALEEFNQKIGYATFQAFIRTIVDDKSLIPSPQDLYAMIQSYDYTAVGQRHAASAVATHGIQQVFKVPVLTAGVSANDLDNDDLFSSLLGTANQDDVSVRALCILLSEHFGYTKVRLFAPFGFGMDHQQFMQELFSTCTAIEFERVLYPVTEFSGSGTFTTTEQEQEQEMWKVFESKINDQQEVNINFVLGDGFDMLPVLLPSTFSSGLLGKGKLWIFYDESFIEHLKRLENARESGLLGALNGSVIIEKAPILDENEFSYVIDFIHANPSLFEKYKGMLGLNVTMKTFLAQYDLRSSFYARSHGALLFDTVRFVSKWIWMTGNDKSVSKTYFWEFIKHMWTLLPSMEVQGLTGNIRFSNNSKFRPVELSTVRFSSLKLETATNGAAQLVKVASFSESQGLQLLHEDGFMSNGGVFEQVPNFKADCVAGSFKPGSSGHICCSLCTGSTRCSVQETCVIVEPYRHCRCDIPSLVNLVAITAREEWKEAALLAVNDFNDGKRAEVVPASCNKKIHLVETINESDGSISQVMDELLEYWTNERAARLDAVVGISSFDLTRVLGTVGGGKLVIGTVNNAAGLSDSWSYQGIFRAVPSFKEAAQGTCLALHLLGFQYVNILSSTDPAQVSDAEALVKACDTLGIRTFMNTLQTSERSSMVHAAQLARTRRLNIHVCFFSCVQPGFTDLLESFHETGLLGQGTLWVFPLWDESSCSEQLKLSAPLSLALHGSIVLKPETLSVEAYLYDTIFSIGLAVCEIYPEDAIDGQHFVEEFISTTTRDDFVFMGATGQVRYSADGNRMESSVKHSLFNLVLGENGHLRLQVIQTVESLDQIGFSETILYNGGSSEVPSDTRREEEDLKRPAGMWWLVFSLFALCLLSSIVSLLWIYLNRAHPIVIISQVQFLLMVVVGTVVLSLSIVGVLLDDRFGLSVAHTGCKIFLWCSNLGFQMTFAPLILKIFRVSHTFRNATKRQAVITNKQLSAMILACCSVDVLILSVWTSSDPVLFQRTVLLSDEYGKPLSSSGSCRSASMVPIFLLQAYHLSLLLYGSYVCWQSQGIASAFSEHKYVASAIISILQVQSIVMPIRFIVTDSPTLEAFVTASFIALTVLPTLAWIFIPKRLFMNGKIRNTGVGKEIIEKLASQQNTGGDLRSAHAQSGGVSRKIHAVKYVDSTLDDSIPGVVNHQREEEESILQ